MVYNPGNQIGKSVRRGGQRPAKDPDGPFLGKSATSTKARSGSSNLDKPRSGRTGNPVRKVNRTIRIP